MNKKSIVTIIAATLAVISISACATNNPAQAPDDLVQTSVVSENTTEQNEENSSPETQGDVNSSDSSAQDGVSARNQDSTDSKAQSSNDSSASGNNTSSDGGSSDASGTGNTGSVNQQPGDSQASSGNQAASGNGSTGNSGNNGNSGNSGNSGKMENSADSRTGNGSGSSSVKPGSSTGNQSGSKTTSKPESSKSDPSGGSGGNSGSSKSSKPESSKSESSKSSGSDHQDETPILPVEMPQSETGNTDSGKSTKDENAVGDEDTYKQIFSVNTKVVVKIDMSKSEIDKLQADYNKYKNKADAKSEIYRKADVTFVVGKTTYKIDEVGIRLKGNNTLAPVYASDGSLNISNYKLKFDETFDDKSDYGSEAKVWASANERKKRKKRTFATLNGMDIKWNVVYDDSFVREIYATRIFEASDVMVQKINLANVEFNGKNYGVMKIYEPIDNNFLEKRLPESALGGDLYKALWSNRTSTGGTTGWRGAEYTSGTSYGVQSNKDGIKYNYNLKTNKKSSKHEQIKNFLSVINKSSPTKNDIEGVVDTEYFAKFMAACYFAGGPDDIRNNYNNHYIYFRKDNRKALFIPYDNDRTLGITIGYNPDGKACSERNPYSNKAAGNNNTEKNPLILKTITTSGISALSYIKDMYTAQLRKIGTSDLMTGTAKFNTMYNSAKRNYESVVTPSVSFKNQKKTFRFSLDGTKNGGDSANMSFDQFRSAIIDTYKKYVK